MSEEIKRERPIPRKEWYKKWWMKFLEHPLVATIVGTLVASVVLFLIRNLFFNNSSFVNDQTPVNNAALRAHDNSQIYIMNSGSITTNGFKQAVDLDKNSTLYSEGKLNFNH